MREQTLQKNEKRSKNVKLKEYNILEEPRKKRKPNEKK